ncbi:MAG TPA: hypothetical protein DCQ06_01340, partial [Myxococcales bacterium]|nr:hypothetical protein [Myxococcales bacterium]
VLADCDVMLPVGLSELIDQMLSKSASNRPASALEVEKRLGNMAKAIREQGSKIPPPAYREEQQLPVDLPNEAQGLQSVQHSSQGAERSDVGAMTIRGVGLAEELKGEMAKRAQRADREGVDRVPPPPSIRAAPKPVVVTAPTAPRAPKQSTESAEPSVSAVAKPQIPPQQSNSEMTESAHSSGEPDRSALSAYAATEKLPERSGSEPSLRRQPDIEPSDTNASTTTWVVVVVVALLAVGVGLYLTLA